MPAITIGSHVIDPVTLPERAQQELITFYEFLIFKYQGEPRSQRERRTILTSIFQEANGKLPENYKFNWEELHER
jgi:hypothetical protein